MSAWLEGHQASLYLAALALGAGLGLLVPGMAGPAGHVVTPALALLLYATFLAVPVASLGSALRDGRFLGAVLILNFVALPVVAFALSRLVAGDAALLAGVLLVLLTPCVDYVIAFTGLAGGARDRLLAATPLLMVAQMLLLPLYLWAFAGPAFASAVELRSFAEAFLVLIVAPLAAAWLTQALAARSAWARAWEGAVGAAMVPLMMLVLAAVVASQILGVGERLASLAWVAPIFLAFAALMVALGLAASSLARLDVPGRRALVLSGVTRNSLVVLPLALALPAGFDLAPLVVVTQTLVELLVLVVLVRLVPALVRDPASARR